MGSLLEELIDICKHEVGEDRLCNISTPCKDLVRLTMGTLTESEQEMLVDVMDRCLEICATELEYGR